MGSGDVDVSSAATCSVGSGALVGWTTYSTFLYISSSAGTGSVGGGGGTSCWVWWICSGWNWVPYCWTLLLSNLFSGGRLLVSIVICFVPQSARRGFRNGVCRVLIDQSYFDSLDRSIQSLNCKTKSSSIETIVSECGRVLCVSKHLFSRQNKHKTNRNECAKRLNDPSSSSSSHSDYVHVVLSGISHHGKRWQWAIGRCTWWVEEVHGGTREHTRRFFGSQPITTLTSPDQLHFRNLAHDSLGHEYLVGLLEQSFRRRHSQASCCDSGTKTRNLQLQNRNVRYLVSSKNTLVKYGWDSKSERMFPRLLFLYHLLYGPCWLEPVNVGCVDVAWSSGRRVVTSSSSSCPTGLQFAGNTRRRTSK